MLYLILFGAPGSGKGTQSDLLVQKYQLSHLSTGDLLRKEIASGSQLGQEIDQIISKGNLIPDDMMIDILVKEIEAHKESKGFILDGFPRTVAQAQALDSMIATREHANTLLVNLEVEKDELINRLLKRGETSGRSDDNLETIQKRLEVYEGKTKPVGQHYEAKNQHAHINGMGTVEEIFSRIENAIQHLI